MAFFLLIAFWIFVFCIIVACCGLRTDDDLRRLIESGQIPEKALDKPPFVSNWEYSRTVGSWMT